MKKGREVESVEKEVANLKVQLEAKDNAYKQALVMIDNHHKTTDDLSILLNKSDLLKDFYINESREAKTRINELEQALSVSEKALESTLDQLMNMKTELSVLREAKMESENLRKEELRRKLEMEVQDKTRFDQAEQISLLETELKKVKIELEKSKEQEDESQVEMAMMKFELHKGRAKLAAAEAAEIRAQTQKSALYNALQQMGLEAEETNKENRLLKEWMQMQLADEEQKEVVKVEEGVDEDGVEMEKVRRELEIAMSKIGELRTRAAQATSRAEAAEKGKGVLEEKIRKRKEHKERRRAALAALREESISRMDDDNSIKCDTSSAKNYQPLGKVLNMKF